MILAVVANIASVGNFAYFYKQLESIREAQAKTDESVQTLIRRVSESGKSEQEVMNVVATIRNQQNQLQQALTAMGEEFDETRDGMEMDLEEIVMVLEERNIQIDRPSRTMRHSRNGDIQRRPRGRNDTLPADTYMGRSSVRAAEPMDRRGMSSRNDRSERSSRREPIRNPPTRRPEPRESEYREPVRETARLGGSFCATETELDDEDVELVNMINRRP